MEMRHMGINPVPTTNNTGRETLFLTCRSAGVRAALISALVVISLLAGACSGGKFDSSEVNEGSVIGQRPATLREDRTPVTGTVVTRSGDRIVQETEYADGFPNGRTREWYPDGKPKLDREVKYVELGQNGQMGGGLQTVGEHKTWCENGTLQADLPHDADGKPIGEHKTWTCGGKLLSRAKMPAGEFKRWIELENSDVVLAEEGMRVDSGHFDGVHKSYYPNGSVMLIETWRDEALRGDYQRFNADGSIAEAGRYENGAKVGMWTEALGSDNYQYWDYDPSNFTRQEYAAAFMQAAGIQPDANSVVLQEYRVDAEKLKYYVAQGLVDPAKKINLDTRSNYTEFKSRGWTYPYVQASREALPVLLELGADPKAADSNQRTRLHWCVGSLYHGTCSAADIKELIELGIDAGKSDSRGYTALHMLMNYRLVPGETNGYGRKRQATIADLGPMIQALTAAGADPDAQTNQGLTATILALQAKMYDVAGALLEKSLKPGQTDRNGLNVIHHAFIVAGLNQVNLDLPDDRRAFVELAVSKGVDPAEPLGDAGSLVAIAEQNGAIELAQYLRQLKP
jgi:antitoxin component YwqK of YwqJK toxin-antitoxin module